MTVRGVIRESVTGRLIRVFSSVMPATAVNSPAESVVGIAMGAGALLPTRTRLPASRL